MTARLVAVLRASKLFGNLPDELLTAFSAGASVRVHDANTALWRANDEALHFNVLNTGLVEVRRPTSNGDVATLGLFGPGDSVGDFAVVSMGTYPADAVAADATSVVRVCAGPVIAAANTDVRVAQAITASLLEHSRILHMKIDIVSAGTVAKRLARLFAYMMRRFGDEREDGHVLVPVRLSRTQLARFIGARAETVIRVMSKWRARGWLEAHDDGYLVSASFPVVTDSTPREESSAYRGAAEP